MLYNYSILVAGAGTSEIDGEYAPSSSLDANGNGYFSLFTGSEEIYCYIETVSSHWVLGKTLNGGPATVIYSANGTATSGPDTATGWVSSFPSQGYVWLGANPAPTVSRVGDPDPVSANVPAPTLITEGLLTGNGNIPTIRVVTSA